MWYNVFLSFWLRRKTAKKKNKVVKQWREQNIFLCVQQKKEIHTGLEWHEGDEMMTKKSFLRWNISLMCAVIEHACYILHMNILLKYFEVN